MDSEWLACWLVSGWSVGGGRRGLFSGRGAKTVGVWKTEEVWKPEGLLPRYQATTVPIGYSTLARALPFD